jgi:ferrous iron transport protein A
MSGAPDMGLHELPQRRLARVVRLLPAGDAEERDVLLRLLEIGFLPGEPVRVMARGFPGSDPLAVRVGHTTFALRSHEAALIRVSLAEGCPA